MLLMAEVYSVEVMALKTPEHVIQQYGEYTSSRNDNTLLCRAVFTISGTAEFPLNHPWQQNFSKGLQSE